MVIPDAREPERALGRRPHAYAPRPVEVWLYRIRAGLTPTTIERMVSEAQPDRSVGSALARRLDHPSRLQRGRAPRAGGRPGHVVDGRLGLQLRDHRRRRRLHRQLGRGRVPHRGHPLHQLPPEPRFGLGAQGRHQGGARPGHRLDRRRHDVPQRHDPAAREGARRATTRWSAPAPPKRERSRRCACPRSG